MGAAIELRAEEGGEVVEVAVAVVDLGEREAVVERELAVAGAQRRERVPVDAVRDAERGPGEAERRLERGGRGEREGPYAQRHRHRRPSAVPADAHLARVLARRRVGRDERLDPDGAALARRDVEGKGVAPLALDLVDVGDERVGPGAGRAIECRGGAHVNERGTVEPDVLDEPGAGERADGRPHVRRGTGDDYLERLELVPRGREERALAAGRGAADGRIFSDARRSRRWLRARRPEETAGRRARRCADVQGGGFSV